MLTISLLFFSRNRRMGKLCPASSVHSSYANTFRQAAAWDEQREEGKFPTSLKP